MNNLNYYKPIILILAILAVIGSIYYVVHFEYYPVAVVNFRPIFSRDYGAIFIAMSNFTKTRSIPMVLNNNLSGGSFDDPSFIENMRRMVLTEMIKNEVFNQGIDDLDIKDLDNKIKNKIESVLSAKDNDPKFLAGVKVLYGLDLEKFKELILVPFARKEIVLDEKKVVDFDEWLGKEKNKSKVYIFLKNMKWDKEKGEVIADY